MLVTEVQIENVILPLCLPIFGRRMFWDCKHSDEADGGTDAGEFEMQSVLLANLFLKVLTYRVRKRQHRFLKFKNDRKIEEYRQIKLTRHHRYTSVLRPDRSTQNFTAHTHTLLGRTNPHPNYLLYNVY